ncbi:Aminotransferase-like plant mobile domain [Arabidopsis thaliana x Arabidopsis arenosa]|uniref:Aminotransferase-like plant mobile domain n=1 Tax=Arabidopsis thaliana x Arabidopsis arenosa TaxID=1240361 RepID=A0A8T2C6P2_9BRAS|nr:Aminotransferase-like plant mobile domain [Arabidopsis thaliana x Arabidopsis arenosa]
MLPCQILSAPSPQINALSSSVSFNGWRFANPRFKFWARKMATLHETIWRKAGIFEAVNASTYNISKNTDLVLDVAEKWCPDTNTFVFPWGETTITLEDVMVLSGLSVLGSPVSATLDSSGEMIMAKLKKEWQTIKRIGKVSHVTQLAWTDRFKNSGDELEHVAFLVLWLSYFVFPSRFHHICEPILSIAVHLSCGTRIALAPAVLAHLYADLSLLKTHIRGFSKSSTRGEIGLSALFKLVQVWTWERFRELQPSPNELLEGKTRVALWNDLKQKTSDARQILDNSKIDSFEWRPYTRSVKNWDFPKFYPEEAMCVRVCPSLDDEFISFARCIKVSELVGIRKVEHYFPNRVASQFGMLQDVPSPVERNKLSREAAWKDYDKPIDDLTLNIPSRSAIPRVTSTFCEWWRKSYPELIQYSSKEKGVVVSAETLKIIGDDTSSGVKRKSTRKDEMTIAEYSNKRLKCIEEARDKRRKYMKQAREIGNNESAGILNLRNIVGDHSSFVLSGSNRTSKDEMKIAEDSNKRSKYVMQDRKNDGSTMGLCQSQLPSENDEEVHSLTIAEPLDLNIHIAVADEIHGQDRLLLHNGLGSKETMKSSEDLEKRNDGSGEGNAGKDSYEERFQKLKVLVSSLEERMNKTQKTVAWLIEQKTVKERRLAAAARLI